MGLDEIPDERWNATRKQNPEKHRGIPMPNPEKEFQSYYQHIELKREERKSPSSIKKDFAKLK